ncbi:MAG: hypothetical protein H0X53_02330 [Sphingomonas sp.]|nr:hypothetical protein [Sphingomonas sp.]
MAFEKGIAGIGDHIDDGIADRQHINIFFGHGARVAAEDAASNVRHPQAKLHCRIASLRWQ